jgi:hypothetical protein
VSDEEDLEEKKLLLGSGGYAFAKLTENKKKSALHLFLQSLSLCERFSIMSILIIANGSA